MDELKIVPPTQKELEKLGKGLINRENWRRMRKMDHEEFSVTCARIYWRGMVDDRQEALNRVKDRLEKKKLENGDAVADFDADQILEDIMSIHGIGETLGGKIARLFEGYAG